MSEKFNKNSKPKNPFQFEYWISWKQVREKESLKVLKRKVFFVRKIKFKKLFDSFMFTRSPQNIVKHYKVFILLSYLNIFVYSLATRFKLRKPKLFFPLNNWISNFGNSWDQTNQFIRLIEVKEKYLKVLPKSQRRAFCWNFYRTFIVEVHRVGKKEVHSLAS